MFSRLVLASLKPRRSFLEIRAGCWDPGTGDLSLWKGAVAKPRGVLTEGFKEHFIATVRVLYANKCAEMQ